VRIHGDRHFGAPTEDVFLALTDPEQVAGAFSAIELVEADGQDWTVVVRPPLPGGFRLKFSVRVDDLREPEHARLRACGKSLAGRLSVNTSFELRPEGDGTWMSWEAEVDAAGLFSGLGSQALGPVATHQAERALTRLADRLERRATAR
jgi:carbon monoxide dehydrogenase subunit G